MLGAVLIVCGLYAVLWGKGKEINKSQSVAPSASFHHQDSGSIDIVIMPNGMSSNNDGLTSNNAPNTVEERRI